MIVLGLEHKDIVGKYYNLLRIKERLEDRYFNRELKDLTIKWGRTTKNVASLGRYYHRQKLITIAPILDSDFVPRYFIEYVVYHEMLHHVIPMPVVAGRRQVHSEAFLRAEAQFLHYKKALQWEEDNTLILIKVAARDD